MTFYSYLQITPQEYNESLQLEAEFIMCDQEYYESLQLKAGFIMCDHFQINMCVHCSLLECAKSFQYVVQTHQIKRIYSLGHLFSCNSTFSHNISTILFEMLIVGA